MRLPVLAAARPEENQVETVSYNGDFTTCVEMEPQGETCIHEAGTKAGSGKYSGKW